MEDFYDKYADYWDEDAMEKIRPVRPKDEDKLVGKSVKNTFRKARQTRQKEKDSLSNIN